MKLVIVGHENGNGIYQLQCLKWKSAQRQRKHYALAVVRWTHKQTNTQTGAITIHCAA